jgi:hypothetical protein
MLHSVYNPKCYLEWRFVLKILALNSICSQRQIPVRLSYDLDIWEKGAPASLWSWQDRKGFDMHDFLR